MLWTIFQNITYINTKLMNSPAPIVAQLRYVSMVDQMGTVLDQSKIWFVKSQEAALCVDVCLSQMHPYVENVSCMLSD